MNPSKMYDPSLHAAGTLAASGACSHHRADSDSACTHDAVVSFQDADGRWQSGCSAALQQLVERGQIEPLGQGA